MAIRITKVYTRTGDKGETALVGGKRVPKDSPRIDAYGTIDELNSVVGLARVFNEESLEAGEGHRFLDEVLCRVQDELFDLGSELATPPEFFKEGIPGGGRIGAYLHQCRTVCRRAEREILRLSRTEDINPRVIKYINRLSDLFFVLSRWIAKQTGQTEYLWQRGLMERPKGK